MKKNTMNTIAILSSYGCGIAAFSLVCLANCARPEYPAQACMNLALSVAALLIAFGVALFPFRAEVIGGRTAKIAAKLRLDRTIVSVPASFVLYAVLIRTALWVTVPMGLSNTELLVLRITGIAASICGIAVGATAVVGAWACTADEEK